MSDPAGPPDEVPDAAVETARPRRALGGFSLVWLVPVLAVAVSAFLIWQNYAARGPLLEIAFENASGVVAGETQLRYRDVAVGVVEDVSFTPTLDRVVVSVRVTEAVAPYIDGDASFYVVRPEISTRGITGIETVLSGVYISGSWDLDPSGLVREHEGSTGLPLADPSEPGLQIVLTGTGDEGLRGNAPILYRGVEVGRVGPVELDPDSLTPRAQAVIDEPFDRLVTSATRFWDASGFDFSLGPGGALLDVGSLSTLVNGGVVFDTVVADASAVEDGTIFRLFPDEASARRSMFQNEGPDEVLRFSAVFSGEVGGLETGAPVELRGIEIGRVTNLTGLVDTERFGDGRVRLLTTLELRPGQIGVNVDGDDALDFIARRVEDGLRARLVNASLLTSGLKVQLVEVPGAPPETLDLAAEPFPLLPTAPADVSDVTATAEGLFDRLSALPVEEILDTAVLFLDGVARFTQSDEFQALPEELAGLTRDARGVVGAPGVQELPALLEATVTDLNAILADIRAREVIEAFEVAADAAREAADDVSESIVDVPALVEELIGLGRDVRALPIDAAVTQATALLASIDAVVDQDSVRALPGELNAAVSDLRLVVADLRREDVALRLSEVLAATSEAASAFAGAAEGAPELVASLTALSDRVGAAPIAEIGQEARAALASLDALLSSEGAQAVPGDLSAAAASLSAVLAEVEARGLVTALGAALDEAAAAAAEVGAATEGLPALVASLTAVADQVGTAPIAEVAEGARTALASLDGLLSQEGTRALPGELAAATASLRAVLAEVEEGGTVASLGTALDEAAAAAVDLGAAADELPELIQSLTVLSDNAGALPLDALGARAQEVLASLDGLLSQEATQALPGELAAAVASVRAIAAELEEARLAATLTATLESAAAAARQVETASAGAPELINNLLALTRTARDLPLEALVERLTEITATADALIGSESTAALPGELGAALAEIRLVLEELRAGGTVANVNATLASARAAADSLAGAAEDLPGVTERINALLDQARDTIANYGGESDVSRAALQALRDAQGAADAITSLARAIERRPNSLLLGR